MRKFLIALLAMIALLVATGCGGKVAAPTAKLTPLSVRLDWTPNALHTPIYVALAKGFYKEAGLDVTVNPATDKDDVLKLVDLGTDTVGLYYMSSVLKAQSKGYNVVSAGAYVQHPLNVVLTDQRAGVKTLKDLEGKSVGFTSDPQPKGALSTTAAELKNMVEKAGGEFSKVKLVDVGDQAVQALATQKVDALGGVYEYHEKQLLDKEGIKTDVYRLNENGAPDFYELVFVTSAANASAQGEAIRQFIQATGQGLRYAQANQDEALGILLKAAPTLKAETEKNSLAVVLPLYRDGAGIFGAQRRDRWESAAKWMVDNKLLTTAPDLDKLLMK